MKLNVMNTMVLAVVLCAGCGTVIQHSAHIPLDGSFRSDREKTMEWMKKNDPTGKVEKIGEEKFGRIYGDLVHEWRAGRLTIAFTTDNSKTPSMKAWVAQDTNTFFSTDGGWVLRLISDNEYYVDWYAPAGLFREYFKRMEH